MLVALLGEQGLAGRGAVRGEARADRRYSAEGVEVRRFDVIDEHHPIAHEDREIDRLVDLTRKALEEGARSAAEVLMLPGRQPDELRAEQIPPVLPGGCRQALGLERGHDPMYGRLWQLDLRSEFGQAEPARFARERPEHLPRPGDHLDPGAAIGLGAQRGAASGRIIR